MSGCTCPHDATRIGCPIHDAPYEAATLALLQRLALEAAQLYAVEAAMYIVAAHQRRVS